MFGKLQADGGMSTALLLTSAHDRSSPSIGAPRDEFAYRDRALTPGMPSRRSPRLRSADRSQDMKPAGEGGSRRRVPLLLGPQPPRPADDISTYRRHFVMETSAQEEMFAPPQRHYEQFSGVSSHKLGFTAEAVQAHGCVPRDHGPDVERQQEVSSPARSISPPLPVKHRRPQRASSQPPASTGARKDWRVDAWREHLARSPSPWSDPLAAESTYNVDFKGDESSVMPMSPSFQGSEVAGLSTPGRAKSPGSWYSHDETYRSYSPGRSRSQAVISPSGRRPPQPLRRRIERDLVGVLHCGYEAPDRTSTYNSDFDKKQQTPQLHSQQRSELTSTPRRNKPFTAKTSYSADYSAQSCNANIDVPWKLVQSCVPASVTRDARATYNVDLLAPRRCASQGRTPSAPRTERTPWQDPLKGKSTYGHDFGAHTPPQCGTPRTPRSGDSRFSTEYTASFMAHSVSPTGSEQRWARGARWRSMSPTILVKKLSAPPQLLAPRKERCFWD